MVKAGKSLSVVVLVLVLSLGVMAVPMGSTVEANPGEIHVGPGQPYATIQAAIDAASAGDTIIVHEGTYDAFTVEDKNNLSIIGQDGVTVNSANMVIEDGQEFGLMAWIAKSTGIRIEDIIFDGGEIHVGVLLGICYDDSTGSITDVTVSYMVGSELAVGIVISGSEEVPSAVDISHLTVEKCILGIWVENAEANLDRCSIKGMAPNGGYGIMATDNAQVTMESCEICDCWKEDPQPGQAGFGIMVGMPPPPPPPPEAAAYMEGLGVVVDGEVSTVKIFGCSKIFNNNFGINVADDGDLVANGSNIEGNDILGVRNLGQVEMTHCIISNNKNGIYVGEGGDLVANFNNIVGNDLLGVYNEAAEEVDATNNWWGDASGPSGAGPGTGDAVSDNVNYNPWLDSPVSDILAYYRGLGLNPDVVETTDLLRAIGDWAGGTIPPGFTQAISTIQLLQLIGEWAGGG